MKSSSAAERNEQVQEMYRKYSGSVKRRCQAYLRDVAAAEDAAQEVFLRLIHHFESVPSEGEAQAYIATCTANLCRNLLRDARAHQQKMDSFTYNTVDEFASHESWVEARQLVQRLLDEADTDARVAVVRYHVDDVNQQAIAEEQNVTRRTVINRIDRFLTHALESMARWDASEPQPPPAEVRPLQLAAVGPKIRRRS